jgi:hypothetical protein
MILTFLFFAFLKKLLSMDTIAFFSEADIKSILITIFSFLDRFIISLRYFDKIPAFLIQQYN